MFFCDYSQKAVTVLSMNLIPHGLVRGNAVAAFVIMLSSLLSYFYNNNVVFLILLLLQVINFGLGCLGRKSLTKWLGEFFAKLFTSEEFEHPKAVRFANCVGFILLSIALFFSLLNIEIGLFFLAACIGASALNGFGGFCIACWFYPRLSRIIKH